MLSTIYLDAANDVVGVVREYPEHTTATLLEYQEVEPTATQRIEGGPTELFSLSDTKKDGYYYHRKTSGDGTQLTHYTKITDLDAVKQDLLYAELSV